MKALEVVTNEVMLFGGGMEPDGDRFKLTEISRQRADCFLDYYYGNEEAFTSSDAFVLCTGGNWILAKDEPDNKGDREALLTADYLVGNGVPSRLIRQEDQSTTTLGNLLFSVQQGLIVPERYSSDHQLGAVSHPKHLERIDDNAQKVGFSEGALGAIPTEQQDDPRREFVLRHGYRIALLGASSLEAVAKREALIGKILS